MLHANERMRKVNQAVDLVSSGRLDADAPVAVFDTNYFAHHQRAARERLFGDAGAFDHFREGFGRSIHDGHFQVIDFHVSIVDATPTQS